LEHLRKFNIPCGVVERWQQHARVRIDLFGFIDVIAMDKGRIIGIQCCAYSGHAAHKNKILTDCRDVARRWIRNGGEIQLWSWKKVTVGARQRWINRTEVITLRDFDED
jgi:hypothetical protein